MTELNCDDCATTRKETEDHTEPTHGYDDNEAPNHQSCEVFDVVITSSQEILVKSMNEPNCDDSGKNSKKKKKKNKKKKKKGINHENGSNLASCEFCNEKINIGGWADLFSTVYRIGNLPCEECQQFYSEQEWFLSFWLLNPLIASDTKRPHCEFCREYPIEWPYTEDCELEWGTIDMRNMADFFCWAIALESHPCGICKQSYHAQEWFCKEAESLSIAAEEGLILYKKGAGPC